MHSFAVCRRRNPQPSTRAPTVASASIASLVRAASEMFDLVAKSVIEVHVGQVYPLQEAARAHVDLEARRTIGATVLIP